MLHNISPLIMLAPRSFGLPKLPYFPNSPADSSHSLLKRPNARRIAVWKSRPRPPYQRFTTLSRPVASAEPARSAARFKPAGFKPLFLLSAVDTEYENIVLKTQVLSVL